MKANLLVVSILICIASSAQAQTTCGAALQTSCPPVAPPIAVGEVWEVMTAENGAPFEVIGTARVRYGKTTWTEKLITGKSPCTNAVFGDSNYGILKQCLALAGTWVKPVVVPPPVAVDCVAKDVPWTQGTSTCNAAYPGAKSGITGSLVDGVDPTTGSVSVACLNGVVTVSNALCTTAVAPPPPPPPPPPPAACPSQAITWTAGTATCSAQYLGGASGTTATLSDTTAPDIGTATAACTSGVVDLSAMLCKTSLPPPPVPGFVPWTCMPKTFGGAGTTLYREESAAGRSYWWMCDPDGKAVTNALIILNNFQPDPARCPSIFNETFAAMFDSPNNPLDGVNAMLQKCAYTPVTGTPDWDNHEFLRQQVGRAAVAQWERMRTLNWVVAASPVFTSVGRAPIAASPGAVVGQSCRPDVASLTEADGSRYMAFGPLFNPAEVAQCIKKSN